MITSSIQAKWVVFSRLYITPYNNFLHQAPSGFRELLQELGIVSCGLVILRKQCIIFELPEELPAVSIITEIHEDSIKSQKSNVSEVIMQMAAYYKTYSGNSISEYESYLLSGWLGFDVGRYMVVNYYDRNKP